MIIETYPKQHAFEMIGMYGCYFLCLDKYSEADSNNYNDIYEIYCIAIDRGYMNDHCYMKAPEMVLSLMTGKVYSCNSKPYNYKNQPEDISILCYSRRFGTSIIKHFCIGDLYDNCVYDPYGESQTRLIGSLDSKRIFREHRGLRP